MAYIYPFSAASASNFQPTFKETLAQLWGEGREKAISEKLFPGGTTKGIDVSNVLCLSPNMHAAGSRYDFALWPMRPSKENESGLWIIQIVFCWLHKRSVGDKMSTLSSMGPEFKTSAKDLLIRTFDRHLQPRAIDLRMNAPILDGQIFTIYAAEKELLPDYDILMLQWDLARMASLCDTPEPDSDSDTDSDYDVEY